MMPASLRDSGDAGPTVRSDQGFQSFMRVYRTAFWAWSLFSA